MTDHFSHLDDFDVIEVPLFPVEAPDGKKALSEIRRQATFLAAMHRLAPGVMVYANANAGKRARGTAKREGIRAGVFDITVAWSGGIAFPEFKGYQASGRAGKLSVHQIGWGNAMHAMGHHVACFFDPMAAVNWLRSLGCPIRDAR